MASTYSTDLSIELVATGEKAGLWGTITVTASKRETNLQDLPMAVQAISAEELEAKNYP